MQKIDLGETSTASTNLPLANTCYTKTEKRLDISGFNLKDTSINLPSVSCSFRIWFRAVQTILLTASHTDGFSYMHTIKLNCKMIPETLFSINHNFHYILHISHTLNIPRKSVYKSCTKTKPNSPAGTCKYTYLYLQIIFHLTMENEEIFEDTTFMESYYWKYLLKYSTATYWTNAWIRI